MFVVFTADDAIQGATIAAVNQFLAHRKNPNGCQPKMTYYTSLGYTNYSLVTDWYVAGNEIADHTMTHVGNPSKAEIDGNLIALNALSGIPMRAIQGFRAPFLNFSVETLEFLREAGFSYDSSASASVPVDDPNTDAFWPYTLDNGMANDCQNDQVRGACNGGLKLNGFWEVPMYAFHDKRGAAGTHLMDPWLDSANGNNGVDDDATLEYMQDTFTKHYEGNRQPIGLYTHPIHVSIPSTPNASKRTIDMINRFLDWAQNQQNVWIVSTEQMLEWVKNPVPVSELDSFGPLRCSTPDVSATICNGMNANQQGLLDHCKFSDFPFHTCYGCPEEYPSPNNPNPAQTKENDHQTRFRLPANCSTPFWDPIKGECICSNSECAFNDDSRAIGPNGANLTGGGTGAADEEDPDSPYVPFNGRASSFGPSVAIAALGVVVGTMSMFAKF